TSLPSSSRASWYPAWNARRSSSPGSPAASTAADSTDPPTGPSVPGLSGRNSRTSDTTPPSGTKLDDIAASAHRQRDPPLPGQAPRHAHDALLRLLHVAQLHRAHLAHVVLHDLGGALGDVGEYLVAHGRARRPERQDEVLARHLLQQVLHVAVLEPEHVLEAEHQVADRLGELGRGLLEVAEDARLDGPVGHVQDVGGALGAAGAGRLGAGD